MTKLPRWRAFARNLRGIVVSNGDRLASYVLVYDPMVDLGLVGPFYGTEDDPNESAIVWALKWESDNKSDKWELFAEVEPGVLRRFINQPIRKP